MRCAIERSAAYGVFSTFGLSSSSPGGTADKDLVVDLRTEGDTFMKMVHVQVRVELGFEVNKNRLIFASTNEPALRNFIDQGCQFGGQANLSAIAGGQGSMFSGAASVAPGVDL